MTGKTEGEEQLRRYLGEGAGSAQALRQEQFHSVRRRQLPVAGRGRTRRAQAALSGTRQRKGARKRGRRSQEEVTGGVRWPAG